MSGWYVEFTTQLAHTRSVLVVGTVDTRDPASHVRTGKHDVALVAVWNVPLVQVVHVRSITLVPSVEMYEPGTHARHDMQLGWLLCDWYRAASHGVHVRSLVGVAGDDSNCVAVHVVAVVHGNVPVALKVPGAHGTTTTCAVTVVDVVRAALSVWGV